MLDEQIVADAVNDDTISNDKPVEGTDDLTAKIGDAADNQPWFLSEGVQGEGDRPDFLNEKYNNALDQAKGYNELQSKFGAFTGAPEKYEVNLSDGNKENGIEIDSEDPLLLAGMELAKEAGMNQEGFDKFVDIFAMQEIATNKAMEELKQEQFKALGDNGEGRINNLVAWGNKNLPSDKHEDFVSMAQNAGYVGVMENIIAKTQPGAMNPKSATPAAAMTADKIKEMQFAKDENGVRRMSEPAYRREFERINKEFNGGEEHNEVVG